MSRSFQERYIHLTEEMWDAIEAGGRSEKQVLEATSEFFTLMANDALTEKQQERCIALLDTGNVDLTGTYKEPSDDFSYLLVRCIRIDPHFCIEAIFRNSVTADNCDQYSDRAFEIVVYNIAESGWEKPLVYCFKTPEMRDRILRRDHWWDGIFGAFEHDLVDFLETLYSLGLMDDSSGLIDEAKAYDIVGVGEANACFDLMLDKGWIPSDNILERLMTSGKTDGIKRALDVGVNAQTIRDQLTTYKKGPAPGGKNRQTLGKHAREMEAKVSSINAHWKWIQEKLDRGAVQYFDTKDLIIAGNMGDEALRQFVNPKHWRKPEDKAHLLEMLEQAPVQVTSRISNQIEVLKGSNAHSNGWGRA